MTYVQVFLQIWLLFIWAVTSRFCLVVLEVPRRLAPHRGARNICYWSDIFRLILCLGFPVLFNNNMDGLLVFLPHLTLCGIEYWVNSTNRSPLLDYTKYISPNTYSPSVSLFLSPCSIFYSLPMVLSWDIDTKHTQPSYQPLHVLAEEAGAVFLPSPNVYIYIMLCRSTAAHCST